MKSTKVVVNSSLKSPPSSSKQSYRPLATSDTRITEILKDINSPIVSSNNDLEIFSKNKSLVSTSANRHYEKSSVRFEDTLPYEVEVGKGKDSFLSIVVTKRNDGNTTCHAPAVSDPLPRPIIISNKQDGRYQKRPRWHSENLSIDKKVNKDIRFENCKIERRRWWIW